MTEQQSWNATKSLEDRIREEICFYSHRDVVPEDEDPGDTTQMTIAESSNVLALLIEIRDRIDAMTMALKKAKNTLEIAQLQGDFSNGVVDPSAGDEGDRVMNSLIDETKDLIKEALQEKSDEQTLGRTYLG